MLKEEGTVPPMPPGAFVKEEQVAPPMPPGAFVKEEQVAPPMPPGAFLKEEGVVPRPCRPTRSSSGSTRSSSRRRSARMAEQSDVYKGASDAGLHMHVHVYKRNSHESFARSIYGPAVLTFYIHLRPLRVLRIRSGTLFLSLSPLWSFFRKP